MANDKTGDFALRDEAIQRMVTGFALQTYKMKQVCMIRNGSAWTETYYQETATELTAKGNRTVGPGIARLAQFPNGDVTFTKVQARIEKYGMEGILSYEDIKFNAVDVLARTLLRIARAVAKAVDDEIWDVITEDQSAVNINTTASTAAWDAASGQNPVEDILECVQEIVEFNYDMESGGYLLLSPKDYKSLLAWLYSQGSNAPRIGEAIVGNGRMGTFIGLTVIVSNSVTADYAAVVKGGECATWVASVPLETHVIDDPGIKKTVRAFEIGVTQLVNPKAVSLLTNTQT